MKVYILMYGEEMLEDVYYTDEDKIDYRVNLLNSMVGRYVPNRYWYKTLELAE